MSDELISIPKVSDRELLTPEAKHWWAYNLKRARLFNLLIQGKSILEIQKLESTQLDFIKRTFSSPFFLKRLESYLLQVLFNYQVNRILALDETFKLFWDVTMGRKILNDLSVDQASKHLIKLLDQKESQPKVINPKQYNIIMNIIKTIGSEKLPDMAKEFGFDKFKTINNEGSDSDTQLDKGEGDQNE